MQIYSEGTSWSQSLTQTGETTSVREQIETVGQKIRGKDPGDCAEGAGKSRWHN